MGFIKSALHRLRGTSLQSAWDKAKAHDWPPSIQRYVENGPSRAKTLNDAKCLALDFETDGLDPQKDPILSAGFVALESGCILGTTSEHWVAKAAGKRPAETVAIHGLTDSDVQAGIPLSELLDHLFEALTGRVMLAHHAVIEVTFLKRACVALYGAAPPLLTLDTLRLEQQRPSRHGKSLRLLDLRAEYGLPTYRNHHALSDAHACAELYLAQLVHTGLGKDPFSKHVSCAL